MTNGANNVSLKEMLMTILSEHQHSHDAQHMATERSLDVAFAAQQSSVSAAFAAQKAAVEAALAASDRANASVNEAQDKRLEGLKEHVAAIQAIHARAHEEAHAADARAIVAALQAQKETSAAALAAQKEAINKADAADQARFEGVNNFRATLSDQQRTLMPRAESEARLTAMQEKIDALQTRIDRGEGRGSGLHAGWGYLVAAVGMLLSILLIGGIIFAALH